MSPSRLLAAVTAIVLVLTIGGCARFQRIPAMPEGRQSDPRTGHVWIADHTESSGLNHVVTLPADHADGRDWPLIVFLHSLEEPGREIERVIENPDGMGRGLASFALADGDFGFVTLSPLCPEGSAFFHLHERLDTLIGEAIERYEIDPDRVYLTGVSMGGMGVWSMAMAHPERFAAAAPMAGGVFSPPMKEDLEALLGVPMWVFHDRDDPHIELRHEQEPVERLQALGGDVRLTITETGRHYIHEPVLEQGALFEWFLAHRRGATTRD